MKFHWKPLLGAHSLVWDEAQKIAGKDPDFHRRDLWEAIEAGDFPEYELGVQIVAERATSTTFDFDLLDATKLIPEELVPVRRIGKMVAEPQSRQLLRRDRAGRVLRRERRARHRLHRTTRCCRRGCFSYLDTQLIRLGGPNFAEIPINRPVARCTTTSRTASASTDRRRAAHLPPEHHRRRLPGPRRATRARYGHYTERVDGTKIRERSESFERPLQPGDAVLAQHVDAGAAAPHRGVPRSSSARSSAPTSASGWSTSSTTSTTTSRAPSPTGSGSASRAHEQGATTAARPRSARPTNRQSRATRKIAVLAADGVDSASLRRVLAALRNAGRDLRGARAARRRTADGRRR